jgi:hypothetical protein
MRIDLKTFGVLQGGQVFAKPNTINQTRLTKQKLFAKTKHNQQKPFDPLLFKASVQCACSGVSWHSFLE